MERQHLDSPAESDPGQLIVDPRVRELYYRFVAAICGFHDDVRTEKSRMEVKAFLGSAILCRIVPYRQLFHVQVGKENVWEIRVRDEGSCSDTLDRVLARFLDIYASRERGQTSPL